MDAGPSSLPKSINDIENKGVVRSTASVFHLIKN
ncbi:hypothetical protein JOD02_001455 [Caldicoprobacter guelmensis]|nr:hypothetical protein [Caldicoprobacter guelmensis]